MTRATPLAQTADIAEALALLTRLPVRARLARGAAAAWAWPLAGLVVAALAGLLALALLRLGAAPSIAAGLALTAQVMLTGALHEDGLADSADGLWGGHDPARRLEIMKDSRIGSYGVIALVLSLALRWSALSLLFAAGHVLAPMVAAAVLSRAPMAVLAAALPNARGTGLSQSTGRPEQATASLAVALAVALALVTRGTAALAPLLLVALTTVAVAALAKRKLGGQTGDILGASQQLAEIAVLCTLA